MQVHQRPARFRYVRGVRNRRQKRKHHLHLASLGHHHPPPPPPPSPSTCLPARLFTCHSRKIVRPALGCRSRTVLRASPLAANAPSRVSLAGAGEDGSSRASPPLTANWSAAKQGKQLRRVRSSTLARAWQARPLVPSCRRVGKREKNTEPCSTTHPRQQASFSPNAN